MVIQKPTFFCKNKEINLNAKVCRGIYKAIGLMFSRREKANALLFEFNKPVRLAIHSWFVFYPFLAIWLDRDNKLIEERVVKPFTIAVKPRKKFFKLVEIPLNSRYEKLLNFSSVIRKI